MIYTYQLHVDKCGMLSWFFAHAAAKECRLPPRRRTNAQMSDSTKKELLRQAREAFARHGYAQAPIEEVVQACGLTRGALYHHFGSKQGLFLAVARQLEEELVERVLSQERAADDRGATRTPLERFLVACRAYLEASLEPDVRRVLIVDAPAVLATLPDARVADAELEISLAPLAAALAELRNEGVLRNLDLAVTTRMLGGALFEAAAWAGAEPDPLQAVETALTSLTLMVTGLTIAAFSR
jgi:AcrR family transcriptional regulator